MTRKKAEEQDIEPAQSKDGSNIEPQAPASNSPAKAASTARSQGKGYALVAVVYLLGLCMGALDMGIVNPARTVIQNTLSVDDSLGVWIITIYTLAYAVSIPIMGKLADRHGRKGVYLLCILLFGIGSALCGVAQDLGNFWILIGARVIQALGGGGIMPVATAEFGTAFPEEKRGMALGIVGMVYGLASILGPTVGSAILEVFGATQWQFIFYVNIPICIIVLILGVKRLPNAQAEKTGPLDGLGILVLTLMTLSLMYGLKNVDFFDFATSIASTDVWPFLVAFVVLLPLFVLRERRAADPILNLKYFTNANIVIAFLCAVISGIAMMGTIFFPQFCENAMMMKSGSGGYFIALLGVGSGVGAMMSGKLIDKHGVKPVLAMGFIGVAIGSIFMAFVACTWPSLLTVCATMIITGLGLGFTMGTPLNYMMLENTDEKESNSALAALSLVRSIGTAIAPAIMVAFVVHASAYLQGNLIDAMPSEVSVSELPHAAELDSELASLRETENGAKMLEGVDIPSLEDYRTIDVGMDSASGDGSFEMSDETLELDARYFAGDTTPDDMRAVGNQFIGMMSSLIGMMVGLSVFIFLLFMYLLTKAVIDRSARSISYMKVFGYRDGEISHLYIRSITLCVVASLVLCEPLLIESLTVIFRTMLLTYNGNIEIYVPWWSMTACVGIGFATYLVVALLHTRSIKRVSLAEALKVQE